MLMGSVASLQKLQPLDASVLQALERKGSTSAKDIDSVDDAGEPGNDHRQTKRKRKQPRAVRSVQRDGQTFEIVPLDAPVVQSIGSKASNPENAAKEFLERSRSKSHHTRRPVAFTGQRPSPLFGVVVKK